MINKNPSVDLNRFTLYYFAYIFAYTGAYIWKAQDTRTHPKVVLH